jgi:maleate cis-trans isomerase
VGFLYPGLGVAEDDLEWLVDQKFPDGSVTAAVVETPIHEDLHTVASLRELGAGWRLAEGAEALTERRPCALVWACTSGSFVLGLAGARRQAAELEAAAGLPASSTSLAFLDAVGALGIERVAIAATYPGEVGERFVSLLREAGIAVEGISSNGIPTAAAAGRVLPDAVTRLVLAGDHPAAEAVLVPDTALHTVRRLADLEAELGKPVLSANQVSVWAALRLAGARPSDSAGLFSLL